jgi:hypothetical protein
VYNDVNKARELEPARRLLLPNARLVPSRFCYSLYALWEGLLFLSPSQDALRAVIPLSQDALSKNKVKKIK